MATEGGAAVRVRPAGGGRTLTGRASLNAVASGLEYGVRAVVELLVSPLVVGGVGAAAYGAWRVLWQWSSYVWGASGRSAQALQFAIAHKQWTADDDEKRQLVGAAVLVWLLFLPLMLAAGLAGIWLAPVVLDVPSDLVTPLRMAAAVLAVDAMAMTLVTLPRSSLVGENLGYTRMGISAALVGVGGGLLVLAVELDLGLPGLAGATLATTLLTGAVFTVITRRRLPWFGVARPSRALARWFLGLSMWFLGWKLVLELLVASDVLVLAAFAPLSVVAAFALSKWVADSMAQVLSILVQATIPGIGGYLGSGAVEVAARLRGEVMSLVWVVGTGIGTTVVVWNGTFVGLWVGEDLYAGHSTTLLVVVLAFQLALIRTDTFIIDVALRPRVKVVAGAVAAVLSISLAAIGAGPLDGGVAGLCLGLVVGRGVLGVVAPVAAGRILGVPLRRQSARVLRPALTTSALFGAGYWLAGVNSVSSWFLLVAGVAGTVVTASGVALFLGLPPLARTRLVRRARVLLRRGGEPRRSAR